MTAPDRTPDRREEDLAAATLAWSEQWLDPEVALLWNPEGSLDGEAPPQSVHLVPQSAWFALGLLARDGAGDRATAAAVFDSLLGCQYDQPGEVWHGTYRRLYETPDPGPDAVEWIDYDPNWRQFLGTTFALALRRFPDRLDPGLVRRIEASIRLAVAGEPPDRVQPSYSNIALMRAWLEIECGRRDGDRALIERGEQLGVAVADRFDRFGTFDEYNSPTYYGVDLYALALWAREPVSEVLEARGTAIERDLWIDTAAYYHAGLRNLCGPYTRSYGTDMRRYAGLLGLWIWDAVGAEHAAYPDLTQRFEHSHDTTMGPPTALLGAAVPEEAVPHLTAFRGEREVERRIGEAPDRTASAWLAEEVMLGGERTDLGVYAMWQFMPATAHWAEGTLRVEHHAPTSAIASPGRLTVQTQPHHTEGPKPVAFVVEAPGAEPAGVRGGRWQLPGIELRLSGPGADGAQATPLGDALLWIELPAPDGPATYDLEIRHLA